MPIIGYIIFGMCANNNISPIIVPTESIYGCHASSLIENEECRATYYCNGDLLCIQMPEIFVYEGKYIATNKQENMSIREQCQ